MELATPSGRSRDGRSITRSRWTRHGHAAGRERALSSALAAGDAVGVLVVGAPGDEQRLHGPEQRHLLDTFVAQIALAVERAQLATEAQRAQVRAEAEEMRSSLLSSVSHDLRTPIGTILGSATMLADERPRSPRRASGSRAGADEAARLGAGANLLDMTRVQSGPWRCGGDPRGAGRRRDDPFEARLRGIG
jgi:K+-sensing histidine kinase KdpD